MCFASDCQNRGVDDARNAVYDNLAQHMDRTVTDIIPIFPNPNTGQDIKGHESWLKMQSWILGGFIAYLFTILRCCGWSKELSESESELTITIVSFWERLACQSKKQSWVFTIRPISKRSWFTGAVKGLLNLISLARWPWLLKTPTKHFDIVWISVTYLINKACTSQD